MDILKNIKNQKLQMNDPTATCGNCWGHQEYLDGYIEKQVDLIKGNNDNFISKFVKKYISKS